MILFLWAEKLTFFHVWKQLEVNYLSEIYETSCYKIATGKANIPKGALVYSLPAAVYQLDASMKSYYQKTCHPHHGDSPHKQCPVDFQPSGPNLAETLN